MDNKKLQTIVSWIIVVAVIFTIIYVASLLIKKLTDNKDVNQINTPKESQFNNKLRQEVQSEVETATAPRPTGNDVYDTMVMRG